MYLCLFILITTIWGDGLLLHTEIVRYEWPVKEIIRGDISMSRQMIKALGILLAVCFLISTASAACHAEAKASSMGEKGLCKEKKSYCAPGQCKCEGGRCYVCCGSIWEVVKYRDGSYVPCGTQGTVTCTGGGTYRLTCWAAENLAFVRQRPSRCPAVRRSQPLQQAGFIFRLLPLSGNLWTKPQTKALASSCM